MKAEDATKAFGAMCLKIFAEDVCDEARRSEILVAEMEGELYKLKIPIDARLAGDIDRSAGCLVYVAIVYSSIRSTDTA
jgi:hypothetical protein